MHLGAPSMNSAARSLFQKIQLQDVAGQAWHILRSPWLFVAGLALLSIILLLSFLIPQQTGRQLVPAVNTEGLWIDNLPPWLQSLGPSLFLLGFSNLLGSMWFWLVAALLLLHGLITLADYGPASYRRLLTDIPALDWQHPLARRNEHTVRLPDTPDDFLTGRKQFLADAGFSLHESNDGEQRMVGAVRRRWAWLGPLVLQVGVFVLLGAFLLSHFGLERDVLTLTSLRNTQIVMLNGSFEVTQAEIDRGTTQVLYQPNQTEAASQTFSWRLLIPAWVNDALIIPTAIDALLTVEVRDETGSLLEITPLQKELATTQRLTAPLPQPDTPILFSIPGASLAFQIVPDPSQTPELYQMEVRQGDEAVLIQNVETPAGQPVKVETFSVTLLPDYNLKIVARRDPGLWFYGLGLLLILTGGAAFFVYPPSQIWLIPEVKGRGGHLYGVMESFATDKKIEQFLERLLNSGEPEG